MFLINRWFSIAGLREDCSRPYLMAEIFAEMFIKSKTTASLLLGSLRQTVHDFSGGKTNNLSSCSHTESMLDEFANLSPAMEENLDLGRNIF